MRRRPPRSTPTDPLFPCTPPFRSLGGWFSLGLSEAASITPGGRLLRRSSGADDRPALFAAQFALSHVCWLIAYPLAGQVGARAGMEMALGASAARAFIGTMVAVRIWPREEPAAIGRASGRESGGQLVECSRVDI